MSDPFVAEIRIFGFNFAPTGWAQCNGQLLPISQNTALFSLLGTMYGGDGKSTFALPNLEGSGAVGAGQGPGLSLYDEGQSGGSEFVTLLQSEMPVHTHNVRAATVFDADQNMPGPQTTFGKSFNGLAYAPTGTGQTIQMNFQTCSIAGGSLPHNNMMPYLTLNFCIAMQGVFPPRG
jgi:microcystin-dependent protein